MKVTTFILILMNPYLTALLEVGVQEFLPSLPTILASSRALEEAGVQVSLTVADLSPVDSSGVPSDGHGRR